MTPTILHCIPSMGGGGAERQLTYLARSLHGLGWNVHVAFNRPGPNLGRLENSGAAIHRLELSANHDPRLALRIAALIRRVRPDIVQTWLPQMDIAAGLVATVLNVPWVLSERSSAGSYPSGAKTQARRRLARHAAAIIANSRVGADYWANGNESGRRSFVVPNGLPTDDIECALPANLCEYGIGPTDSLVVFAGRFSPEKNIPLLIDALAQASTTHAFKALLCGDGPLLEAMRELVIQRGLSTRIVLPGYVEDMWGVLKRANVYISVSAYEGHPNGVLEALACGARPIVSDIEAHRAVVNDDAARFVPLNDVRATRDAILASMTTHVSDATAVRTRSYTEQSTVAAVARTYHDIYCRILNRQTAAPVAARAS